jgi:hypothetical protein
MEGDKSALYQLKRRKGRVLCKIHTLFMADNVLAGVMVTCGGVVLAAR